MHVTSSEGNPRDRALRKAGQSSEKSEAENFTNKADYLPGRTSLIGRYFKYIK